MKARDRERGQIRPRQVRRESHELARESSVGMSGGKIGRQVEIRVWPGVRQARGEAPGLAPFPESAGWPHRLVLEDGIDGGIRARELGIMIVDHPSRFGKLAFDLAFEQLDVRRKLEPAIRKEYLNHRVERPQAPSKGLRLGKLDENAPPGGRRCEEHGEGATPKNVTSESIGRCFLSLTEHQHAKVAPGKHRGGYE